MLLDSYCKTIQVEALTALKMAKNEIYPAIIRYLGDISQASDNIAKNGVDNTYLVDDVTYISKLVAKTKTKIKMLETNIIKAQNVKSSSLDAAYIWRDDVLVSMEKLRKNIDELETIIDKKYWPMPTYVDLLFGI